MLTFRVEGKYDLLVRDCFIICSTYAPIAAKKWSSLKSPSYFSR